MSLRQCALLWNNVHFPGLAYVTRFIDTLFLSADNGSGFSVLNIYYYYYYYYLFILLLFLVE